MAQSLLGRVRLPELYDTQRRIYEEAARFNVLCIGRRAGKTYLGVRLALEAALAGQMVGWFAPTYKLLSEAWEAMLLPLFPIREQCRINQTHGTIRLPNGGKLEMWSLSDNPDAGRSREYHRVIVDEAAVAPKLRQAWEEGISPTLATTRGDAWFLSTPKGLNFFYDLFQRQFSPEVYPNWRSWQLPSSVSPYFLPEEYERERREKPELAFRQEILAEFVSGEGAVFRNVDACLTAPQTGPEAHRGHVIVMAVDWAKVNDFTAISVICCNCGCEVHLDRFNQIGWAIQRDRVLAAAERWGVRYLAVERNSIGGPNLEALYDAAPRGITVAGFETTAKSKPKLIQSLALAFEKELLRFLPDPAGRHELLAYEATVTESGYTKYSAPEGQHDDTVIARALAWRTARAYLPVPLTEHEREEAALHPGHRVQSAPPRESPEYDQWESAREWARGRNRQREREANRNINDPWSGWTANQGEDDPFRGMDD